MIDDVLAHFPAAVHPLILVSDPDDVLGHEGVVARLQERGFTLVWATDPVQLRLALARVGPFSLLRPTLVITPHPTNTLPYDLWQQGQAIDLALHTFFPRLAYPVVQALSPDQRVLLSQLPPPTTSLGPQASRDWVLAHLFGWTAAQGESGAAWVAWLTSYHHGAAGPMPASWLTDLAAAWQKMPALAPWPTATLAADRHAFAHWLQTEWETYVSHQTREPDVVYHSLFDRHQELQDQLPQLVRQGVVQQVVVSRQEGEKMPAWAQVALIASDHEQRQARLQALFEQFAAWTDDFLAAATWSQWQPIAAQWAEATRWRYQPDGRLPLPLRQTYARWQARLDAAFLPWLENHYARLANRRLPQPHHLFHVPHWLAWRHPRERLALLVLDGMSLADWQLIEARWRQQRPAWQWQRQLLLAQIPTLTAISRQALLSGLLPAQFAASLTHNRQEEALWQAFWQAQGLAKSQVALARLRLGEEPLPDELSSSRVRVLGLVYAGMDALIHHATQGAADHQASLRLWLEQQGDALAGVIAGLLADGYRVYLTSDHGHTEAQGWGQPSEGLLVQTRSKRARVYASRQLAAEVQARYPQSLLWESKGLMPADSYTLLAPDRHAFAAPHEVVVTHGGASLDEVVVPFVGITP